MVRDVLFLAALALLGASCKGTAATTAPPDAGPEDATPGVPCGTGGVSKGPWSTAASDTGVVIRWEACTQGTAASVTATPETGGAPISMDAVETATVVTESTTTPLNPDFPDLAGTFYMHEAKLAGLAAGTCYRYTLAADPAAYRGRFCTARPSGSPVHFIAIGDTNPTLGDNTKNVLDQVVPTNPDFVIHGGDLQYYSSGFETWSAWFPIMAPLLRAGAIFPAIGNHESEKPTEYAEYSERFFGGAGFDGTESYYRFSSGGVWFFSVDTQQDITPTSDEGAWLLASLANAVTQPGYRFSIVYFHRPFLTCGDQTDNPGGYAYFDPVFRQNHVLLVLQAHMHGYERFDTGGLTYVTTAGGGGIMGNVDENISRSYCAKRVASGAFFHAMDIEIAGSAEAGPTVISAKAIDRDGAVRDSFQISPP